MTVSIIPATERYLDKVIERSIYNEDKATIRLTNDFFKRSAFSWIGFADGHAACAYGLIAPSLLNDSAYLWLVTNDLVDKHQFSFVRHSQIEVKKMLILFPRIVGHVWAHEERSKRWLKWLGVKLSNPENGLIAFELRSA